tara:strand:- start:778 stop:963 length:186 start_codon:yes stop_codon:yes gene_type:complete
MTLISKEVTHFWVTFEKVLHFRTGARAPILGKKQIGGVGAANANHYHLHSCLEKPGREKAK